MPYLWDYIVLSEVVSSTPAVCFRVRSVGEGRLTHTVEGFRLQGCGGKLDYRQSPTASYSLYSDYFWYELGDMICIGDSRALYYCFPREGGDVVAKTRLATEELYKMQT